MNLNKTFLIGNLTRDPELKTLPSGGSVCNFSIATNRTWNDKSSGQKKQDTEFHNIVVFGKMAESTAEYMKKGSSLLVEGRIQTRSWEGQDGVKKYKTEIVAESIQFGAKSSSSSQQSEQEPSEPEEEEEIKVEDIPF